MTVGGRGLLAAISIALFAGVGQAQTGGSETSTVLAPGDLVRITVWENPSLSGEFTVNPEGTLNHPLYQEVHVAGVPLSQAKARLHDFLAGTYTKDPLLTVEPLFRVMVGGEVRLPNLYSVPRGTTVTQAVALAGGVTDRGKPSSVRLIRRGKNTIIDLNRPEPEGEASTLMSGDQVVVPRGHNVFRDFLGPFSSLTAAIVSVIVVVRQ
jgi:polysaccharide export outer membrane protein